MVPPWHYYEGTGEDNCCCTQLGDSKLAQHKYKKRETNNIGVGELEFKGKFAIGVLVCKVFERMLRTSSP
jgi:hypothetical protein